MGTDYATTREAADPFCLRVGEAAALLRGHPWRRFVVLGDSVAEGVGDPSVGYLPLPWADRIAAELTAQRPDLDYLNLGERNLRAAEVRARQLDEALAFRPDLALVACGANDALDPRYLPDAVDREVGQIVAALQECGADVMTVSVLVLADFPAFPEGLREPLVARLRVLGRRTGALGAALGTLHVDLAAHPATREPGMHSSDGLHGNGRSHAISAAEAVRRLGAYLGNTFRPAG